MQSSLQKWNIFPQNEIIVTYSFCISAIINPKMLKIKCSLKLNVGECMSSSNEKKIKKEKKLNPRTTYL